MPRQKEESRCSLVAVHPPIEQLQRSAALETISNKSSKNRRDPSRRHRQRRRLHLAAAMSSKRRGRSRSGRAWRSPQVNGRDSLRHCQLVADGISNRPGLNDAISGIVNAAGETHREKERGENRDAGSPPATFVTRPKNRQRCETKLRCVQQSRWILTHRRNRPKN